MRRPPLCSSLLSALLLCSCSIVDTAGTVYDYSPAAELGRPGWVRFFAGIGGGLGAVAGGVVSIAALPVTLPLSLMADDELSDQGGDQLLFLPASTISAFGTAALGFPADCLDWTFRRAWTSREGDVVLANEPVPMVPPVLPAREPVPGGSGEGS